MRLVITHLDRFSSKISDCSNGPQDNYASCWFQLHKGIASSITCATVILIPVIAYFAFRHQAVSATGQRTIAIAAVVINAVPIVTSFSFVKFSVTAFVDGLTGTLLRITKLIFSTTHAHRLTYIGISGSMKKA